LLWPCIWLHDSNEAAERQRERGDRWVRFIF